MESKNFMAVDEVAQKFNVFKFYVYKGCQRVECGMQQPGYI